MKKLEVKVEFLSTIRHLVKGFLFCTNKLDKIDDYIDEYSNPDGSDRIVLSEKGKKLLYSNLINNPNPHTQLFNKMQLNIEIFNTTRAVLQEFARHRSGWEITVKSTRFALHHIADDERISNEITAVDSDNEQHLEKVVSDYFFIPEDDFVNNRERAYWLADRYNELSKIKYYKTEHNTPNDKLKKYINDYMYCNIDLTCSVQALRNFFYRRLSKRAFYQIRTLAQEMYRGIPDDLKFLFEVYEWKESDIYEYIKTLREESFEGWSEDAERGYLTALTSIEEKLLPHKIYYRQSLTEDIE